MEAGEREQLAEPPNANGEPEGYWGIAAGHSARLRRYALRLCRGNEEDAMDLTQQTLAKTADCAGVGERGDPWPLFRRVMVNAFVDRIRVRRRETGLEAEVAAEDPGRMVESRYRQTQLQSALRRLAPDQVHMIRLVYGEGYSQLEAALQLGLTEEAVKQRLKRARAKLRGACPALQEWI